MFDSKMSTFVITSEIQKLEKLTQLMSLKIIFKLVERNCVLIMRDVQQNSLKIVIELESSAIIPIIIQ